MIKKLIYLFFIASFIWLLHEKIYITPNQRLMNNAVSTKSTTNTFTENFENLVTTKDLFKSDWSRWHELLLQNNAFSIRRPVRYCLIDRDDCFTSPVLGNYIEISKDIKYRGKAALKLHAQKFNRKWLSDSRVAVRRQLFGFKKGDDIYFSGWFYFKGEEGIKAREADNLNHNMILSFRSRNNSLRNYGEPGRALFFSARNHLGLKMDNWLPAIDQVHQDLLNRINLPTDEWVELKMHLKLSDVESEGIIEVWQNDKKILSERAITLPAAETVYSILEIGIGSNLNQGHDQTMYIDNLYVSPTRFAD